MLRVLVENGGGRDIILKQTKHGLTARHCACNRDSLGIECCGFFWKMEEEKNGWVDCASPCLQP